MARPIKEGLDYFPLDVDIDQDDKVAIIEAQHGIKGFGIVVKLLMLIYKNSYYYEWTEREQILFSNRVNVDINEINVVIGDCIKWGMFDENLFNDYSILTSRGIQKRYIEATSRRQKVEMVEEWLLVDVPRDEDKYQYLVIVNINSIDDDINSQSSDINDDTGTQSKVKESKVKESKVDDVVCAREEFNDTVREKPKDTSTTSTPVKPCLESEVVKAISRDISPTPSSIWLDEIDGYLKAGIQEEVILYAIQTAVDNNVRNWAYIRAILRDFLNNEIKTMDEVHDRERKRTKSKRGARDRPRLGDFTMSEESEKELDEFSEQRKVPLHIRMKQEGKL